MKTVEEKSNMLANMEGFEPMNSVEAEKVEGGTKIKIIWYDAQGNRHKFILK